MCYGRGHARLAAVGCQCTALPCAFTTAKKRLPARLRAALAALVCPGWRGALQKRTPPCCCALAGVAALCRNARRRAVVLWLAWRSVEAHAAVLLCAGWRGGALQKRTPPCCCALAGVALWRSARRRAVVLWLALWRSAEAHAAVLLCSGWRTALQNPLAITLAAAN